MIFCNQNPDIPYIYASTKIVYIAFTYNYRRPVCQTWHIDTHWPLFRYSHFYFSTVGNASECRKPYQPLPQLGNYLQLARIHVYWKHNKNVRNEDCGTLSPHEKHNASEMWGAKVLSQKPMYDNDYLIPGRSYTYNLMLVFFYVCVYKLR